MQEQAPGDLGVAAFAAGVAAQTAQAICLREVLEVARGGEAVLGLALAAWLMGGALGALTWRGRGAAALTFLPLLLVPLLRVLPVTAGGWAPLASLLALPMAYGPGAFFGAVLRRTPPRRAIALEAGGAGGAGALLTFLLFDKVPAMALVAAAGALCVAATTRRGLALLLLVPLAVPADGFFLDRRARGIWRGSEPVAIAESPYGRLLWLRRGEQRALFVGGQLALTVPDDVDAEAFVNVVLAAHPNPRRVLILGPGLSGIARECLRHPVEKLEVAVEDERILDVVREGPGEPGRVRIRVGDPRRIAAEEPRDVVLSLSPPPLTLSSNRMFTREFFAAVNLAPGGLLAFTLPAAPNEREGEVMARNVSVFRALGNAVVLPGTHDLLLSGAPDVDPATIAARLLARGIVLRHHAQDFFAEEFAPEEVSRVTAAYRDYPARPKPFVPFDVAPREPLAHAPDPLPNEDLHPGAVLLSAAALAREAGVPLLGWATRLAPFSPALLLLVVLGRRRALSVTTSGAASMGLWTTVLMAYQARVGALYGDLALLAAAFMAGLALGARARMRPSVIDALFAAAAVAVWLALPFAGRWMAVGLAIGVGALGGATLAVAAAAAPERAPRLYAWDLFGAALAALVFGTFLVPALGAMGACAVVAGLKLLSLALATRPGP